MSTTWRVAMALSVAGMVLLPLFGLLLRFQPRFVHGLHVNAHVAERNCYIAAGCYGGLFLLSAVMLSVASRRDTRRAHERETSATEEAIYGKTSVKKTGGIHSGDRHESRSSSREDTTIMLDSPMDDHHASL